MPVGEKAVQNEYAGIAEIFARSRVLHPQSPALITTERTWTYCELGSLVDAAAFRLKRMLHAESGRIAIVGGNHLSYIAAYWAAHQLGCSTVEINRNESLKTIQGILNVTQARFAVTDRDDLKSAMRGKLHVESFDEFLSKCEALDNEGGIVESFDAESRNNSADGSKEASIVYTSGTTASAKGVVLTHGNFCFIARAVADYLDLTEKDRCALFLPLYHTYGKSILISAFFAGAAVVVLDGFSNQQKYLHQLTSENCTVLSVVPYHLHTLVKSGYLSKYDFSSLRVITSSADKLSSSVIDSLTGALPNVRIFSMYGLTEATTRVCYLPPELLHVKKGSCGRPLPGVEIRIVLDDGTPAPAGVSGEMLVRGPNVMKGYFGEDNLTNAVIVAGWLKTGDLGHMDADGFLYIDGRKKDIIKCMGERISPREIEEALMEHSGVEEAAVVGRQDSLTGEIIHAYVTARDPSLKVADLRDHCRERLSHFKTPLRYTIIENFPRTGTGKIQKNMLI